MPTHYIGSALLVMMMWWDKKFFSLTYNEKHHRLSCKLFSSHIRHKTQPPLEVTWAAFQPSKSPRDSTAARSSVRGWHSCGTHPHNILMALWHFCRHSVRLAKKFREEIRWVSRAVADVDSWCQLTLMIMRRNRKFQLQSVIARGPWRARHENDGWNKKKRESRKKEHEHGNDDNESSARWKRWRIITSDPQEHWVFSVVRAA